MSLRDDLLECINIKDRVERQVAAAGIITMALEPLGIIPIVVGGAAVEFYTLGQYATMDIDFVGIINDDMNILVGTMDKVQPVEYKGKQAYFIGIEDLILNRVQEAEHGKDLNSAEWARTLMVTH